jgi:hypothetical protein
VDSSDIVFDKGCTPQLGSPKLVEFTYPHRPSKKQRSARVASIDWLQYHHWEKSPPSIIVRLQVARRTSLFTARRMSCHPTVSTYTLVNTTELPVNRLGRLLSCTVAGVRPSLRFGPTVRAPVVTDAASVGAPSATAISR